MLARFIGSHQMKTAVLIVTMLVFTTVATSGRADTGSEGSSQSWFEDYKGAAKNFVGQLSDPKDSLQQQELYRTLFGTSAFAYIHLFLSDTEHPQFRPYLNQVNATLAANPDDSYYMTPIDAKGVYRISGFRGTVRIVDFQIAGGSFLSRGTKEQGMTLSNYDLDQVTLGEAGEFEVILSAERPEAYQGDWWKLEAGATNIIVRQIAYDWVNEVDARLVIERMDTPAMKPRQKADQIEKDLAQISDYTINWMDFALRFIEERYTQKGLINKVDSYFLPGGGKSGQLYGGGIFDLTHDEALIFQARVPDTCRYWNIQLTDMLWRTLDWTYRQSSLNGHQAWVGDDGVFRAVISLGDPGIANWLDPVDYSQGTLLYRWTDCDSFPEPVVTKVKFADLRKHLPNDTPVVTPAQRDVSIRERTRGAQLRRRW